MTWGLDIGDFVHNLRSALDHLVWSLIVHHGIAPTNRHEFPVFLDEVDYRRSAPKKLAGLSSGALDEFESLQPFRSPVAGLEPQVQPLWLLHQMDVVDKHRLLHVVRCIADTSALTTPDLFPGGTARFFALDDVRDGTLIAEITSSSPIEAMQIGGLLSTVIMIEGTENTPRLPWGVLAAMRDAVRAAVSRLTPLFV